MTELQRMFDLEIHARESFDNLKSGVKAVEHSSTIGGRLLTVRIEATRLNSPFGMIDGRRSVWFVDGKRAKYSAVSEIVNKSDKKRAQKSH